MRSHFQAVLAVLRREWEAFLFLAFFALWFSLMLGGSLWQDEVTYASAASSILHGHIFVNLEHPPLAKYMIALGLLLLGDNELGARAPAVLFGLGTLYLTYKCARLLGGRAQALLSMTLLGMTAGFVTYAVQAMLDVFLAFFVMLLFYMLLRFETERPDPEGPAMRRWCAAFGIVSGLLLLTKLYGVFFVAVAFAHLLWRLSSAATSERGAEAKGGERGARRYLMPAPAARFLWLGLFLTIGSVYLPYLVRPDLLVYYVVGWNAAHVATGHDELVGNLTFRYPPVWSYLFWIYEQGFVYLVALAVVAVSMLKKLRSGELEPLHRVYLAYTMLPLLVLSLFTLKISRYIVQLFPLLAVAVFPLLSLDLGRAAQWFCRGAGWKASGRAIARASLAAVCLLVMAIPSPIVATLNAPQIGADSHYREAADLVARFCEQDPGATIETVAVYSKTLLFYLEKRHPQVANLHVVNLRWASAPAILDSLEKGRVHLVLDERINPRYRDTELHAYVREHAVDVLPVGGDLSLFVMRRP